MKSLSFSGLIEGFFRGSVNERLFGSNEHPSIVHEPSEFLSQVRRPNHARNVSVLNGVVMGLQTIKRFNCCIHRSKLLPIELPVVPTHHIVGLVGSV